MRSLKIKDSDKLFSQEVLDLTQNIMLRLYKLDNGYGFRFITYQKGKEVDPLNNSELTWVYGPIKKIDEVKVTAIQYYLTLIQK